MLYRMASRNVVLGLVNDENKTSRMVKKPPNGSIKPIQSRAALGDMSANTQHVKKPNALKSMPPPAQLPKKHILKETNKPNNVLVKPVVSKPPLKRQESIIQKPIPDVKPSNHISYSSKQLAVIVDPDIGSKNEPQLVTEYVTDIFAHLRNLETIYPIRKHFLEGHKTTPKMRSILINWLVDVNTNFKLYLETLHLCVAIIDRYLQENKNVGKESLQLVGAASLLIAAKYEEMYLPDISDFVYICDEIFTKAQILQMEIDILKKLDFNLGRPLSVHFLRRYSKIAEVRPEHHTLAKYVLELALLDYELSHVKPSLLAAAACCLSIAVLNEVIDITKVWTPTLVHYTTYKYLDFKQVMVGLAHNIVKSETSKFQNVRKKYSTARHSKISLSSKLNGPLIRKLTSAKE